MQWAQQTGVLNPKVFRSFFNLRCHLQQVEAADDPGDPVIAADGFGVLRDIADPGMAAARDDRKALIPTIHQSGVLKHIVRFP